MECFFPRMTDPVPEEETAVKEEIPWEPIIEAEIYRALKAAKKNTAPGQDGLPTMVWQKIWSYISIIVTQIFTASVNLGHYPARWKTAMIVVLRKPGEPGSEINGTANCAKSYVTTQKPAYLSHSNASIQLIYLFTQPNGDNKGSNAC